MKAFTAKPPRISAAPGGPKRSVPPVTVEHVVERHRVVELYGDDGEPGKDGVNAFPNAHLTYSVGFVRHTLDASRREYTGARLEQATDGAQKRLGVREEYNPAQKFSLPAGEYRITLGPDVDSFAIVGQRIVVINGQVDDIRGVVIPSVIELPAFVAGAPDFRLRLLIEFVEQPKHGE